MNDDNNSNNDNNTINHDSDHHMHIHNGPFVPSDVAAASAGSELGAPPKDGPEK